MTIKAYTELKVWQLAMDLAETVYTATESFPPSETYGLTSQMRRSAISIATNIAEGYGRESTKSYIHFLKTARGSLKELETLIMFSHRVRRLDGRSFNSLTAGAANVGRLLNALINSLQEKLPTGFSED